MDDLTDEKIILIRGDKGEEEFVARYHDRIGAVVDYSKDVSVATPVSLARMSFDEAVRDYRDHTFVIGGFCCYFEISDKLKGMRITDFCGIPEYEARLLYNKRKEKNIFLLLTPDYGNIGDQAIAVAATNLIKRIMPEYELIEIDLGILRRILPWGKKIILPQDKIYITGGGFAGSLWVDGGEKYIRSIIADFPENEITILPQSLFFEHTPSGQHEKQITKRIYGSHKALKIILREKYSYELANQLLGKPDRLCLLPDVVLSMQYGGHEGCNTHEKRAGICLKSDKESLLSEAQKAVVSEQLRKAGYEINIFSTQVGRKIYPFQRSLEVQKKLDEISGYDLVVTDCLHGMLFCAITGTPCIAIDQISHKVRGEYKWISELLFIYFAERIEDVNDILLDKLVNSDKTKRFHYDKYYEELTEFLRGNMHA